mmetsp:Transcript_115999/g.308529  ORF Transcript_115999/g.308529 Transcript_115999/m.308529 type:complete len:210 (+) Transcript_115999:82-711(+)
MHLSDDQLRRLGTGGARLDHLVAAAPGDAVHQHLDVLVVLAVVAVGPAEEAHGEGLHHRATVGLWRHGEGHRVVVVLRARGHVVGLADEVHGLLEGPEVRKAERPLCRRLRLVGAVRAARRDAEVHEVRGAEGVLEDLKAHGAAGAAAAAAVHVLAVGHAARRVAPAGALEAGRGGLRKRGEEDERCLAHAAVGRGDPMEAEVRPRRLS